MYYIHKSAVHTVIHTYNTQVYMCT